VGADAGSEYVARRAIRQKGLDPLKSLNLRRCSQLEFRPIGNFEFDCRLKVGIFKNAECVVEGPDLGTFERDDLG